MNVKENTIYMYITMGIKPKKTIVHRIDGDNMVYSLLKFNHISSNLYITKFDPALLQSVYKPRSRLFMILAVDGTLNFNQPTILQNIFNLL